MMQTKDLENRLWEAADHMRANSALRLNEFAEPVLGLIFLKFAGVKFSKTEKEIATERKAKTKNYGGASVVRERPVSSSDYHAQGTLYVPEKARYSYLIELPEGTDMGKAVNDAMKEIEAENKELAGDAYKYYRAVLPEPKAEDYYQEVTAYKVIASRIREVIDEDTDVSQVKKDLENLLDRSIRAGEYVIKDAPKLKDLSKIDFEALRKFFDDSDTKNIEAEHLSAELEEKIKEMIRKNKLRKHFLDRLNKLLHEYNTGSHNLDVFFDQLVELAKELSAEDARAISENLTEEELAVFDILRKESLNPTETDQVKKVAKELLAKLKAEKLVLDWKKKQEMQADVKITIQEILYDELPEPAYSKEDCEDRTQKVYFHVYDNYVDEKVNVYA